MSMLKRKIKHITKSDARRAIGRHELECDMCHAEIIICSQDVTRVICDYCVQSMVMSPNQLDPKKVATGYPHGWHLKKLFISDDGKYFCKGKEITKEAADILAVENDDTVVVDVPKKKRGRPPKVKSSIKKKVVQKKKKTTTKG